MNFVKEQGSPVKDINEILAEHFQRQLEYKLHWASKLNKEIVNDFAYIDLGNNQVCPNITYAYGSTTLSGLLEGFDMLVDNLLSNAKGQLSFRQPVCIEVNEKGYYVLDVRCADLGKPVEHLSKAP